ncbi:hypothetical protein [Escherichia sp. E2562]|nr:hypothetical protein [Escherichia sp. E2562]
MQIALIETGSVESISKTMQILNSMDIPTKAIVDLDFAFRGAIRNNFLEHNDEDILRLKEILRSMHANGECTLDGSGLPTKGSNTTAAEAFALMSQKPGAREFLSSLAAKLRNANIWIWLNGSIENHLGLTEKNESVWADFKTKADTQPLSDICADFESIEALVDWITPDV